MDAINLVLSNSFGQFHKMLGSSCLAYKECEIRKQQIIHSNVFQNVSELEMDSLLCVLYTKAQKHIEMEILFLYLVITQLHYLTNGKIHLKEKPTKNKSKKLKKNHRKRGGTRNTKGQQVVEPFMKAKTTTLISLFLLLSLKSLNAQSMDITTVAALKLHKAELDPLNYTQMEAFAEKFGLLNKGMTKQYASANITAEFHSSRQDMFRYFSEMMSPTFHDDVIAKTNSLFNDNIYPIHKSLIHICEMTMKESTEKSPAEIGEIFTQLMEATKEEFFSEKDRIIERVANEIDDEITVETGIPKESLFSSLIRTFSYGKELTSGSSSLDLDSRSRLGWERLQERLPGILDNHERVYINNIKDNLRKENNKFQNLKNRKIFLENICQVSIQPPLLNYNKTESIIYFTDFPEQRSLVEAMISNVLLYAEKNKNVLTEDEEKKHLKQIEMATFLGDIFVKWDKTFANAIMYGHKGKKDVDSFFKAIIWEINVLHEEMGVGFSGNPANKKKAIETIREASNEADIINMNIDARQIIQEQVDGERRQTIDAYSNYYNFLLDFATKPIEVGYLKGKYAATELLTYILGVCALGVVAVYVVVHTAVYAASALLYMRTATPFLLPKSSVQGDNNMKIKAVAPQTNQLRLTDVKKEYVRRRKDKKLLLRRVNNKCNNGYAYEDRLGGCVEKGNNTTNYVNWYLSRIEEEYDKTRSYAKVSEEEQRSPYFSPLLLEEKKEEVVAAAGGAKKESKPIRRTTIKRRSKSF